MSDIDWKAQCGDTLRVRVTPKASRERIVSEMQTDGSVLLRVYVTCVPEDGKANKAVIALLAKALGVAKSRVVITHGLTDRNKIIHIG